MCPLHTSHVQKFSVRGLGSTEKVDIFFVLEGVRTSILKKIWPIVVVCCFFFFFFFFFFLWGWGGDLPFPSVDQRMSHLCLERLSLSVGQNMIKQNSEFKVQSCRLKAQI